MFYQFFKIFGKMGIGNLGIGKMASANWETAKWNIAIWDVTGGNALPCGYIRNQGNATKNSGLYQQQCQSSICSAHACGLSRGARLNWPRYWLLQRCSTVRSCPWQKCTTACALMASIVVHDCALMAFLQRCTTSCSWLSYRGARLGTHGLCRSARLGNHCLCRDTYK